MDLKLNLYYLESHLVGGKKKKSTPRNEFKESFDISKWCYEFLELVFYEILYIIDEESALCKNL